MLGGFLTELILNSYLVFAVSGLAPNVMEAFKVFVPILVHVTVVVCVWPEQDKGDGIAISGGNVNMITSPVFCCIVDVTDTVYLFTNPFTKFSGVIANVIVGFDVMNVVTPVETLSIGLLLASFVVMVKELVTSVVLGFYKPSILRKMGVPIEVKPLFEKASVILTVTGLV